MPTPEDRHRRRERQTREVEVSQEELRASIEKTRQLLSQSETMLKRHRSECDEAETG
jgi:hypothetical protein